MINLEGIVLINKPEGISSAEVVRRIKKVQGVYKVGHAGTLDPFATGLLVCCINKATRLSRFFLSSQKKYKGVLLLGTDTDTQDSTGSIIRQSDICSVQVKRVVEVISKFIGRMKQVPPAFSALKQDGVPLYKLARKGTYVNKSPRSIFIYNIKVCNIDLPEVFFEIHCSAGTYVRTVCADIGTTLGCGGHLKSLNRTASGSFSIDEARNLESITSSKDIFDYILPMAKSLDFMPSYIADPFLVRKIRHGVKLDMSTFSNIVLSSDNSFFKVTDNQGSLVAVLGQSYKSSLCNYYCVF